jgi:hypothetical protein
LEALIGADIEHPNVLSDYGIVEGAAILLVFYFTLPI